MTQIQAYENMSKEALLEHHLHTLQQHADENTSLQKAAAWYEKGLEDAITERDSYQEQADNLAHAISKYFGVDIGEHSSANNPWAEALEVISDAATPTAPIVAAQALNDEERTGLIALLRAIRPSYGDVGSRDVDVAAQQMRIDRAIELLTGEQCTCPSGDGSLRWPCPVHPPESEQKVQP